MTAVDESLSQSPSWSPPKQQTSRPLFGFGEPKDVPPSNLDPNQSPLAGESLEELEDLEELEQASAGGWDDESDPSDSLSGTSSPGSTRVGNPLAGEGLRDVFRGGVKIAGHQAHTYLVRTPGQAEAGLYLADDEDAERIGDPLARIAERHQGLGEVNPDTADLLAAMVGLTRYATKQIDRGRVAKQLDGQAPQQAGPVDL